jgi:hypothetical protein
MSMFKSMSISRSSSTKDSRVATGATAAYREDFVRVVARVGVDSHQAERLAEAMSGQPFQTCTPEDLVPALAHLGALAEHLRTGQVSRSWSCRD